MPQTNTRQLFLLADHLKLSLLERQRAEALNLDTAKQDTEITRSLTTLSEGLEELGADDDANPDHSQLRKQYEDLYRQYYGEAPAVPETLRRPNDDSLAEDFEAAQKKPSAAERARARASKSVRFRDDPEENQGDADEDANRAALFAEQERYRDEPEGPDQTGLDNQQIHAYHSQVIREQDEQLDVLGQSVRRQRMLGIEMGNELEEQNELLDDVERGVDRHGSTLERARTKLGNVARKSKDNWNWVTIGILICILVLLIILLK